MNKIKCPALHCNGGVVVNVYDHEGPCKQCSGTGFVFAEHSEPAFDPAVDMPKNKEQALAVLEKWADPLCMTFSALKTKRIWELLRDTQPHPARDPAPLVEALRLALEYWEHRMQRYKNRHPVWVQDARAVLAAWEGK